MNEARSLLVLVLVLVTLILAVRVADSAELEGYPWQIPHAQVDAKGGISMRQEPYQPVLGRAVRYIDFEGGDDSRTGTSPEQAWRHHPWDANATATAKEGGGRLTYVFKGGVDYRGTLVVQNQGTAAEPVRLLRDPAWGRGPARILGSERVTGWTKGTRLKDVPEPDKVWTAELPFAPRCLWLVQADGSAQRIPLARTPNWRESNPDDVLSEWWS
jgi:hypothetical protein